MVVCVLVPRFALLAALGEEHGARVIISEPIALAPRRSGEQAIGEVSPPAEAFGVAPGMRLGEALARCPELALVPPDPEGERERWSRALDRIDRIGAAPESARAGSLFFSADGLHGIHGGNLEGVLAATRRAVGRGARLGAGPSRFVARCAALQSRPRRAPVVVEERDAARFLAPLPVAQLNVRPELESTVGALERLGIRTLGELAALSSRSMSERFGHPGLLALDLAHGRDTPLDPRRPPEPVLERIELPEGFSGGQLEHALELLIASVLARRERRGRTLRAVAASARLVSGGTWRASTTLRVASSDPARILLALAPRLAGLPAPADSLALEVEAFGPPAHDQRTLLADEDDPADPARRARLGEAVRQARQAAGEHAALRVLDVDPDSRLPERRSTLVPRDP